MALDELEEEPKKKYGGIGGVLRNKQLLYALSQGLSEVGRGGDFSYFGQGVNRGIAGWQDMQDERRAREMAHLEAQNAAQQRERMAAFRDRLSPDQQALFDLDPKAWTGAEIKAAHATTKGTGTKQKYDELVAMGVSPKDAFNLAYGKKSMRIRTNPDGSMEFYEGYDEEAQKPITLGAEARGRYAAGMPNLDRANDALSEMEASGYNPNKDLFAQGVAALEDSPIFKYTLPGLPSYAAKIVGGEDYQQFEQQQKAYETTVLPVLSGMAVTPTEAARMVKASLSEPGDGPAVRKAKALYRRTLFETAKVLVAGGEYDIEAIQREADRIEDMMRGEGGENNNDASNVDALVEQYRTK